MTGLGNRSGCCYEDTGLVLHAACSGTYSYRPGPTCSPEDRLCGCECHVAGTALATRVQSHRARIVPTRLRQGAA